MERFEQELRNALRREQPSGDFAACVLAKVAQSEPRHAWWRQRLMSPGKLRWAVAAILCVVVLAGLAYRQQQVRRRAEGEAARQQVMLALRIAGTKMRLAQAKVQQLSER